MAATVFSDAASERWTVRREQAEYPLKAGRAIEIHNPWGDVQVRGIGDPHVAVFAMLQSPDDQAGDLSVEAREGAVLRLDVVHSNPTAAQGRADLACFVPTGADLTIHTTHGAIVVKGVPNNVVARSVTGNIMVKKPRRVDAYSESGDILALLEGRRWETPPRLATDTGDIAVRLLCLAPVDIDAVTGGEIRSDYPVHVRPQSDLLLKTARIKIRRPGLFRTLFGFLTRKARLDAESVAGDIELLGPFPEMHKS